MKKKNNKQLKKKKEKNFIINKTIFSRFIVKHLEKLLYFKNILISALENNSIK